MKDLASDLGLSAPAVAERVKRLETAGVICGYRAVIDRKKLGHEITVFVNLDIPANKYVDFCEFADEAPEISEFYFVTGRHSLIVKAFVDDTGHLAKVLERIQVFGNTETYVVMHTNIKDEVN
jgi:Lrp/AsnC family leucine-responsive transcriptional regulator